jgi:hypothetical protein
MVSDLPLYHSQQVFQILKDVDGLIVSLTTNGVEGGGFLSADVSDVAGEQYLLLHQTKRKSFLYAYPSYERNAKSDYGRMVPFRSRLYIYVR